MKKFYLSAIVAACATLGCGAQVLNVGEIAKVNLPADENRVAVALSPQGDYLLTSTWEKAGLQKVDLASGETTRLTDAANAGYDVKITADGKTVVFRADQFVDRLRYTSVKSLNLGTGAESELLAPSRDVQSISVEANTAAMVQKGTVKAKAIGGGNATTAAPQLSIANHQLMLTRGTESKVLSPNGTEESYIWPSISPDGTKALYFVVGDGAYICNLDGTGVKRLGVLRAPKWWTNDVVIGMRNVDDGYFTTESSLVAQRTSDGTEQTLTNGTVIAMWPVVAPAAGKIAFTSPAGDTYVINNVELIK